MITNEIVEYIKKERLKGFSDDAIKAIMLKSGWAEIDFQEAVNAINNPVANPVVSSSSAPVFKPELKSEAKPISEFVPKTTTFAVPVNQESGPVNTPISSVNPNISNANSNIKTFDTPVTPQKNNIFKIIIIILTVFILLGLGYMFLTKSSLLPSLNFMKNAQEVQNDTTNQMNNVLDNNNNSVDTNTMDTSTNTTNDNINLPEQVNTNTSDTITDVIVPVVEPEKIVEPEPKVLTKDDKIQSIVVTIGSFAELFYNSNNNTYKGFCSNRGPNGGYTNAQSLPLGSDYKCKDSSTAFVVSVKLSNNKYYCVDSTGVSKEISARSSGFACE